MSKESKAKAEQAKRDLMAMTPEERRAALTKAIGSDPEAKAMLKALNSPINQMSPLHQALFGVKIQDPRSVAGISTITTSPMPHPDSVSQEKLKEVLSALEKEEAERIEAFRQVALSQGFDFDKGDGLVVPMDFDLDNIPTDYLGSVHKNPTCTRPVLVRNPNRGPDSTDFFSLG